MKNNNKKKINLATSLKLLFKTFSKYRYIVFAAIFLTIVTTTFIVIRPLGINIIITDIQKLIGNPKAPLDQEAKNKIYQERIPLYSILIIASAVLGLVLDFIVSSAMSFVSNKVALNYRQKTFRKVAKIPLNSLQEKSEGEILSIISNDTSTISESISGNIVAFISSILSFFGILIAMFFINWQLALIILGNTLVFSILFIITISRAPKLFFRRQKDLSKVTGKAEETYSGLSIVRIYDGNKKEYDLFDKQSKKLFQSSWKSNFVAGLAFPIINFITSINYLLVFVVGTIFIVNSDEKAKLTSDIITFSIYANLFRQPLANLSQSLFGLQQAGASIYKVEAFLELPEEDNKKDENITITNPLIEFKNVDFGYKEDQTIIKDFNLVIKPNQKIAIVGPTGAGKTTIVNMLNRYNEISSGSILINGTNIKDLSRTDLRNNISAVWQDSWLLNGDLNQNISMSEQYDLDKIDSISKSIGLDRIKNVIGDKNKINDDSNSLSAGEKQLISIARAMYKKAPILVLDEATSNIDTRTEKIIQDAMDSLTDNRTSIIIAHRLSTIEKADSIIYLKDGKIIEQGSHQELINNKSYYYDLYNSQFQK